MASQVAIKHKANTINLQQIWLPRKILRMYLTHEDRFVAKWYKDKSELYMCNYHNRIKVTSETLKLDNFVWIISAETCNFEETAFQWWDIETIYRSDHRTGNVHSIGAWNAVGAYIMWKMSYICRSKILRLFRNVF